ncbi:hypothetical protein SynSYN20_00639 [Synechococcus sp. SYN20]|nr:hypothetical protein SynMVIR181_00649 [Synechococcus sp. MVIR-18-1]QNJ24989.1 hypothetical protein SynSYN20_00639 [Synechococcus sp. SYN20]
MLPCAVQNHNPITALFATLTLPSASQDLLPLAKASSITKF